MQVLGHLFIYFYILSIFVKSPCIFANLNFMWFVSKFKNDGKDDFNFSFESIFLLNTKLFVFVCLLVLCVCFNEIMVIMSVKYI